MSKNLLQIFNRYEPDAENAAYLRSGDPESIRLQVDRENRCMIVSCAFDPPIPLEKLCFLEEEIKETYDLRMFEAAVRYFR